jgi:2,3-dihydroxybenzoate-AMP ligase
VSTMSEDFPRHSKEDAQKYGRQRWWLGLTMADILDRVADVFPKKEALVDDTVRLTFSELRTRVDRLAAGLMNLGIAKGDTVLLQLPNWGEFVYSYFALQRIGAIPVLLISGYKQLEVSHLARLTQAKAWIVPDAYRKIDYLSFIGEVKEKNPQLKHFISVRAKKEGGEFTASMETLMERDLSASDRHNLEKRKPEPEDIAHIIPSGGTTGLPKGIPRTHNDYICNVEYQHKGWDSCSRDICLIFVPIGHNLALLNVIGSILVGFKLVLSDSSRPQDICRLIQTEKVTYVPTVPSIVRRILDFEELEDHDLTSLHKISAGGELSSPDLIREVYRKLSCTYINEFGMSEGLVCRTRLADDVETICQTVGKPVCPYEQIKIVDEAGGELPPGKDGELVARGPGIFAGYWKNPEENRRCFTGDGFFKTGDQARIDAFGNLKITGRIKDIIIRGGENISPAQVEDILRSFPGIADVAVIGMPDRELGEKVCAYLQPVPGMKIDPQEVKSFMESQGASQLLIPERFEFADSLPMTEAGKHNKKALREDIKQKMTAL